MKELPIADCRLPIAELFAGCRFTRGGHNGGEFAGFFQERGQFGFRHGAGLDEQFQPETRLIGLFLDGSDFGDELGLAAGAATGAIVGCHGSATADDLFGDDAPGIVGLRNGTREFDDSQGKGFRAGFEFEGIHGANLQTQSAIGNRQSAISK